MKPYEIEFSSEIEKLIRCNEVNGAKPKKYFCCPRCVFGSGEHNCKLKEGPDDPKSNG